MSNHRDRIVDEVHDSCDSSGFLQDVPHLGNQFTEDSALQSYLGRLIPLNNGINGSVLPESMRADLTRFGAMVVYELWPDSHALNRTHKQPVLRRFDEWGRRVDSVETSTEWDNMKRVGASIVGVSYLRQFGAASRLFQFAKLYLFHPSSGMFSCPLAMTDGAAHLFEGVLDHLKHNKYADEHALPRVTSSWIPDELSPHTEWLVAQTYQRLTSLNADHFWTSGQWMTERKGGSDVGDGTETVAHLQPDGSYRLSGFKWFTSATDSDMTLTLARIVDPASGKTVGGSRGLSCFFLPVQSRHINFIGPNDFCAARNRSGAAFVKHLAPDHGGNALNNIRIAQLKDKLGTKQLPTAELELCGSRAYLISKPGRGVAAIVNMVNITRLYNSISSAGFMRRAVALARDYAHRRVAFGKRLADHPLHLETLAIMEIKTRACLLFTLDAVAILGRLENAPPGTDVRSDELLLRIVTPLVKLFTAKLAVDVTSEGLECFGGQGYVETTGIPTLLRDAQVLPIWEGTTNVLSHDVFRVFAKTGMLACNELFGRARRCMVQARRSSNADRLIVAVVALEAALQILEHFVHDQMPGMRPDAGVEAIARNVSYSLARVMIGSLFVEHAATTGDDRDVWCAVQWSVGDLHGVGQLVSRAILDAVCLHRPQCMKLMAQVHREQVRCSVPLQERLVLVRNVALDIDPITSHPQGHGAIDSHDGRARARL